MRSLHILPFAVVLLQVHSVRLELTNAAYNGDFVKVKELIASGADVNSPDQNNVTALHMAAQQGHIDIVNFLLEHKANVNARAVFNTTPLHSGATTGQYGVCRRLIDNGADVNARGKNDTTPLHQAASGGHLNIVQLLVEKGAKTDVRQSDPPNDLPIALAVGVGHDRIVQYLLDNGGDVNSSNTNKVTLLQVASYHNQIRVVELLLARGADVSAKNSRGMTALELAEQVHNGDIVEILRKHKAFSVSPKAAPSPKVPAAEQGAAQRIDVSGPVQAARLIRQPKPSYPPLANQARIQGTVQFKAIIGKDGAVQSLELVSGHPLLAPAAQEAVKQWVYMPTVIDGKAVEVITDIDVNFRLEPGTGRSEAEPKGGSSALQDALLRALPRHLDFTLSRTGKPQKVGDIAVRLTMTNPKLARYSVQIIAGDFVLQKANKNVHEKLQFYVPGDRIPHTLVVDEVSGDTIKGYLLFPDRKTDTAR